METILAFFSDNFWASVILLGTVVTSICGLINSKFTIPSVWKQVIAWVLSIAFTIGGYFAHVFTVAEPTWLSLIFTGLIVGLTSNGIYDIKFIKNLIKSWGAVTTVE